MNKKGFTLVEIIAIMVVIGIISVLVLPQVKSNAYNKKQKQYENIVSTIENAAKTYYIKNSSVSTIYLSTLVTEDYLSSNLVNPITEEQITGCVKVSTDIEGIRQYTFESDINAC